MKSYLRLTQPEREKKNERSAHLIHYTLKAVDRLLLLAESQNGALIGMNVALIRAFRSTGEITDITMPVLAMLLSSIALASFSFYPRIFQDREIRSGKWRLLSQDVSRDSDNLLDVRVISRHSTASYLRSLYELEEVILSNPQEIPVSLFWFADEIVVKSKITVKKHRVFRLALLITIVSCVLKLGEILLTL